MDHVVGIGGDIVAAKQAILNCQARLVITKWIGCELARVWMTTLRDTMFIPLRFTLCECEMHEFIETLLLLFLLSYSSRNLGGFDAFYKKIKKIQKMDRWKIFKMHGLLPGSVPLKALTGRSWTQCWAAFSSCGNQHVLDIKLQLQGIYLGITNKKSLLGIYLNES